MVWRGCKTELLNTYNIHDHRVLDDFHPWAGRDVFVDKIVEKAGVPFARCRLNGDVPSLPLELRMAQKRIIDEPWRYIGRLVTSVKPDECANYLKNAGCGSVKTAETRSTSGFLEMPWR